VRHDNNGFFRVNFSTQFFHTIDKTLPFSIVVEDKAFDPVPCIGRGSDRLTLTVWKGEVGICTSGCSGFSRNRDNRFSARKSVSPPVGGKERWHRGI